MAGIDAMYLLDLTLPMIAENLALDEALLLEAEAGGAEVLRFWEWKQPAVILGAGCRLADDVDEAACQSDGVPILRRSSGGGTVLLGPGCLCFSLVLNYDRAAELGDIRTSYAYILGRIRDVHADLSAEIACAGTSDVACGGRKFSGNSQQRKRRHLLHHGTILYGFDLTLVGRYVRMPLRRPDYRKERDHVSFLANLAIEPAEIRRRLRSAWQAKTELPAVPHGSMQQLVADKYSREEWVRRR